MTTFNKEEKMLLLLNDEIQIHFHLSNFVLGVQVNYKTIDEV